MIKIIPSNQRHFENFDWLKTYWLFSFAEYYDPENIQFGALRVFNDDIVAPKTGFPTHPHREMEIVTLVHDGAITHKDSMGNTATISAGEVQRMSAGTGIFHSEFNLGETPVHFHQIWLLPDTPRLKPGYEQKNFSGVSRKNCFLPVASGQGLMDVVTINSSSTIYLGEIDGGATLDYPISDSRRVFVYVTAGDMFLNNQKILLGDQARIDLETALQFTSKKGGKFVLIDVPTCKGFGYDKKTLQGSKK